MMRNNGMTEEELGRQSQINKDLAQLNVEPYVEHQSWSDRYIANIDAELLIELVTTFNLMYAQMKAINDPRTWMHITGRFLHEDPEGRRQGWIDTVERADAVVTRINKGLG